MHRALSHRLTLPVVAVAAGLLVSAGALLPWIRMFAGLRTVSGLAGNNGRLLVIGGLVVALLGVSFAWRATPAARWAIGLLGFALATLSGWVLVNGLRLVEDLGQQPLLVADLGPGPIVSLVGAVLAVATMFLPAPSSEAVQPDLQTSAAAGD